jgi:hypothetical protein
MKRYLACALILGLSAARVRAQMGETAMGQLLAQYGDGTVPHVAAVPAAAPADDEMPPVKTGLVSFAQCTGALPSGQAMVPIALDFLKNKTGTGTMYLTFPGFLGTPELPHELKITKDDERGTTVELYSFLDPTIKFAEFIIPKTEKSLVSIYAIHFQAEWAIVECVR